MPCDAFPGDDEPVSIEGDPEELLSKLMEPDAGEVEAVEPEVDE